MKTRRKFIKDLSMGAVLLSAPTIPGCFSIKTITAKVPLKSRKVKRALVLWHSQTGYTKINAQLIAKTLESLNIQVISSKIDDYHSEQINQFDLIILGAPVFYYDIPEHVKNWIKKLPDINGTAVASFVTFGGPEGNQHNAACSILELLAEKNGVPIGLNSFMNMASYPLSWSDKKEYIRPQNPVKWRNNNLPDKTTYKKVRQYAKSLIHQIEQGKDNSFTKKMTIREFSTYFAPIWWTKLAISNHRIKEEICIECGLCVEKCPVNAIDLENFSINTASCVLCFGCINNCPVQAIHMEYKGQQVIGYNYFMQLQKLEVTLPPELSKTNG